MGSVPNGAYLRPKTLFVSGLRRSTSGRLPKIRRRVSCCVRSRITSTSLRPSPPSTPTAAARRASSKAPTNSPPSPSARSRSNHRDSAAHRPAVGYHGRRLRPLQGASGSPHQTQGFTLGCHLLPRWGFSATRRMAKAQGGARRNPGANPIQSVPRPKGPLQSIPVLVCMSAKLGKWGYNAD